MSLVEKLRDKVPGIRLTTDIIVGFPGETNKDFEDTLDIIEKVRYDSAFTFCILSDKAHQPQNGKSNRPEIKQDRFNQLLKK